jgi:hypothetical protein
MLITMMNPPGVWISIIGMLSAPTSLRRYVCAIWGAYCKAARTADETPRKVAQMLSCDLTAPEGSVGEDSSSINVTKIQKTLRFAYA